MPIMFHCPKCGKHIKAPDGSGGKHSKCPSCQQDVYIPVPMEELEPLEFAPEDEDARKHEEELLAETRAVAAELRHATPASNASEAASSGASNAALAAVIHRWVLHMSAGELDQADELRERIHRQKPKAETIIEQILSDEIPPDALANIPRPVLNGLLKQLLSESD